MHAGDLGRGGRGGGRGRDRRGGAACDSYWALTSVGPTSSSAACRRTGRRIVATASEPTHAEAGAKDVLERLVGLAERAIAATRKELPGAEILGVGVGAPGPLDTKRGIVLLTPNLGWVNLPLRQIIHDRLGLPAALDNDANCAVLGEWWVGAARGARHAIGITIGTGIGGGLSSTASCIMARRTWRARSATPPSTPRAAAASAATTAASRPTHRDPTSRCARWRRSRPEP